MMSHQLAKQLNTNAFTVGRDIFFARGWSHLGNPRLLAHELSHSLDAEPDVVRRAPPGELHTSIPRIELEGKSNEEIARQVYDAYRCVVPSAVNQILIQLVPLPRVRLAAVTAHVEWLIQHPPVDPPKPLYTRSDAYRTYLVANELATMSGIPTDLLKHHRKMGDWVADPDVDLSKYSRADHDIHLSGADMDATQVIIDAVNANDPGVLAKALLDTGLMRTVFHEATHSMLEYHLDITADQRSDLGKEIAAIYRDAVEFYKQNPETETGGTFTDFERVAHEAIARYVGARAYAFSFAYFHAPEARAKSPNMTKKEMANYLQRISTPPDEAAAGYQPDHSGKQHLAKHPLPDSLLKRIDAAFLPSLDRAFINNVRAKQAAERARR